LRNTLYAVIALLAVSDLRAATEITLLHFSDYHSHALPFYSEDREDQGGIARAVGYLRRQKRRGALVFSGGDMMNQGAPAWSDRFQCAEWPWLNGIVDAMALGNHEADYGFEELRRCISRLTYPILSANTEGFQPSAVLKSKGLRIGVFAVAGSDFAQLVKVAELRFSDSVAAARETVRRLREDEKVDAVVMIGHQHRDADYALARAVPGIDLIFGTHSHLKQELIQIPGTTTRFISPFQYLTYISQVEMSFNDQRRLTAIRGRLVPVDSSMRADRATARRVQRMQQELESDPRYRELFVPFARLTRAMSVDSLARYSVDVMRQVAAADFAISTKSSFRGALPRGPVDLELLRAALPYDNQIVIADLPASSVEKLVALSQLGEGAFISAWGRLQPAGSGPIVRVATVDYLANIAPEYRDVFAAASVRSTGIRLREEVRKRLEAEWPLRPAFRTRLSQEEETAQAR
jgi:5'-nucleotidase/UDP-sugar diphosphatase